MRRWLVGSGIAVVVVPVLAVAALLVAGLRDGAGVNDAEVYVDRPPIDVFAWLKDGDNAPRWVDGLVALEPLDEGPLRPGYRQNAHFEMDGERFTLRMECTALREGRAIEWRVAVPSEEAIGFDERVVQEVLPDGEGARFHVRAETAYHGAVAELFEPLITASAQDKLEEDLERFRDLAEADIPASSPGFLSLR